MMIARDELVRCALTMLGTPFRHQGRKPGVGLDCIGLIVCAVRLAGGEPHDFLGYGRIPRADVLLAEIGKGCEQVPLEERRTGDVVCFQWRTGWPMHFGLLVGRNGGTETYEHAAEDVGRVALMSVEERRARILHSAWRIRGVA